MKSITELNWTGIVLSIIGVSIFGLVMTAICSDHAIVGYTVATGGSGGGWSGGGGAGVCVVAERNWWPNTTAFCSDDVEKTLKVWGTLNGGSRVRQTAAATAFTTGEVR